jgi:hypothetical protein
VYHKTAEGRILSSIVDKKTAITFRKKPLKATSGTAAAAGATQSADELNMKPEGAAGDGPQA